MGLGNENIALINRLGGKTGECISTNEAILCAEIDRLQKIEVAARAIADNSEEVEFNDGMGFAAGLDYLSELNGVLDEATVERLVADGHTEHCAARHVWGDGECECQKKGVYPIQKWSQTCRGCGSVETWEAKDFFDATEKLPSGWGYDQILKGPVCPKCKA